eukprot:2307099-Pyramimonas_sp.AAC.1
MHRAVCGRTVAWAAPVASGRAPTNGAWLKHQIVLGRASPSAMLRTCPPPHDLGPVPDRDRSCPSFASPPL